MMLFKLSLNNIRKSFKDYAIYFFTLILGVAIFYTFNAIDSQTVMLNVSSSTRDLIKLMTSALSGVSVFVSFVLGFLIIYASRFLMKRRNKEFGIYMTLGMSKGSISKILLVETLLIGILSLAIGIGLGVFLSQLMSILVANMFEADLTRFAFTFSIPSFIKTIGYFGIMYIVVMIFNTISVSKCKLIDLIYAHKKSEKVRLKNPILCIFVFILSAVTLGILYYCVTNDNLLAVSASFIILIIIGGCIATFFLFWSLSGLLLRIVQSNKRFYYNGINSFTFRQISSKINTTVMSMSVICIMIFFTICILSSALSLKDSMNNDLKTLVPADIQFYKNMNLTMANKNDGYTKEQIENSHLSIEEVLNLFDFDYENNLKDIVKTTIYTDPNLSIGKTLGTAKEQINEDYPRLKLDTLEMIVSLSDYNRLAKILNLEELTLNDKEYVVVADYDSWVKIRNVALKNNSTLSINGQVYEPKYKEVKNGFLQMSPQHLNIGYLVLPDEAVKNMVQDVSFITANYNTEDNLEKHKIESKVESLNSNLYRDYGLNITTKISLKEASVGLGAMITFIGIYLGIIFLLSSAAVLALKELSESVDNKERYKMLRKIGVDEKMINHSILTQMGIFFSAPLFIAIIHSIFGIAFCNIILTTMGTTQLLSSIIMTSVVIIVIYGGYFLITYFTSKNIIKN